MCCCVRAKQGNEKDKNLRQLAFHGKTEKNSSFGHEELPSTKKKVVSAYIDEKTLSKHEK